MRCGSSELLLLLQGLMFGGCIHHCHDNRSLQEKTNDAHVNALNHRKQDTKTDPSTSSTKPRDT